MSRFSSPIFPIKNYGNVPKKFTKEMRQGLAQFPVGVKKAIWQTGELDEIRLAPSLAESAKDMPDLLKTAYSKHPVFPDKTYDDILSGVAYRNDPSFIGMYFNPKKSHPANKGTLGHELSHKADAAFEKKFGVEMSQTDEFNKAFDLDTVDFALKKQEHADLFEKYGKRNLEYIFQGKQPNCIDDMGLAEVLAEVGASITTGASKEVMRNIKFFEKVFPETQKAVVGLFNKLAQK